MERLRITEGGNVGIGTEIPTDAVHSTNNAKLAVGIVTAREYYGTFKGDIESNVITLNANLEDVFSVSSGNELSADSAGADKIVFWDNDGGSTSAGELTYLAIDSTTLEIDTTNTLKVKASFGSLSNLDVKQFSNHTTTPKTERTCPNPIEVNISGIGATIGIGSTSNAYGRRYIQDTAPSTGVCEGDIWYDTSSPSLGSDRVAILRDEKTSGTAGGQYSAGVWHTRTLNVEYDSFSFVSLSSNVFSMAAGDYKINWSAPALHVDNFQTRIAYTTDSTFSSGINYYYGSSAYSGETGSGGGNYSDSVDQSFGEYLSSTTATTYYRIEQKISTSESTSDFGAAASMGLEVYLQVAIEDLSTAVKEGSGFVDKIE